VDKTPFKFDEADDRHKAKVILFSLWHMWGSPGDTFPVPTHGPTFLDQVEFTSQRAHQRFHTFVQEITWEAMVRGLVTPNIDNRVHGLPGLSLTELGKTVVADLSKSPYNSREFIEVVRIEAGRVATDQAVAYVRQALDCFEHSLWIPSVLLLGIASECMLFALADILASSLSDSNEAQTLKNAKMSSAGKVIRRIQNIHNNHRKPLRALEGLDLSLIAVADLIRRQRNEVGHPQEELPEVTARRAYEHMYAFSAFAADLGRFAEFLSVNKL
jgi:hypothetical protein